MPAPVLRCPAKIDDTVDYRHRCRYRSSDGWLKLTVVSRTVEAHGEELCKKMDRMRYTEMGMRCLTWEYHRDKKGRVMYFWLVIPGLVFKD